LPLAVLKSVLHRAKALSVAVQSVIGGHAKPQTAGLFQQKSMPGCSMPIFCGGEPEQAEKTGILKEIKTIGNAKKTNAFLMINFINLNFHTLFNSDKPHLNTNRLQTLNIFGYFWHSSLRFVRIVAV
jgi:hypothetical protein